MIEGLLGSVAFPMIHLQQHANEVLRVLRDVLPVRGVEREGAQSHFRQDLGIGLAEEWGIAAEHDVHDDADAPHVAELIVLARQDLRRHVVRRAGLRLEKLAWFELARKTEIDDFEEILLDGVLGHEQEIFRFEISVANMVLVHVVDGSDDLLHEDGGLNLGEVSRFDDSIEELTTSRKFHYEIYVSVILERLVEFDDVGMIHHLHDGNFLLEAVDVLHLCLGDRLDRPNVARSLIFGLANGAVRAFS
mmetsp:Transcript_22175/g.48492  ORF Transcript_22175/g.48492 Transcript_22175/m.48492 type:complete len:248 (+) Transcript_22175:770-1513(+)